MTMTGRARTRHRLLWTVLCSAVLAGLLLQFAPVVRPAGGGGDAPAAVVLLTDGGWDDGDDLATAEDEPFRSIAVRLGPALICRSPRERIRDAGRLVPPLRAPGGRIRVRRPAEESLAARAGVALLNRLGVSLT